MLPFIVILKKAYMEFPPSFKETFRRKMVYKLKKSLYSLKHSPRAWFEKFTKPIHKIEFVQSQGHHTLFYKHVEGHKITILIMYVDDIILASIKLLTQLKWSNQREYLHRSLKLIILDISLELKLLDQEREFFYHDKSIS